MVAEISNQCHNWSTWSGGASFHGRLELEQLVGLGVTFNCQWNGDLESLLDDLSLFFIIHRPKKRSEYLQHFATKNWHKKHVCAVYVYIYILY